MRKYIIIICFTLVLAFLSVAGCSGLGATSKAPDSIVGKWKTTDGGLEFHVVLYKDGRVEFSQYQKSPYLKLSSWEGTWKSIGQNDYIVTTSSLKGTEDWVYIPSSDTIEGRFLGHYQIFHRYQ